MTVNYVAMSNPAEIIAALKERHKNGESLAAMARAAGLHANSLNRLYDHKWRPRLDTLQKVCHWMGGVEQDDGAAVLPLAGDGWEVARESDGWYVITETSAIGPYAELRRAVERGRSMSSHSGAVAIP